MNLKIWVADNLIWAAEYWSALPEDDQKIVDVKVVEGTENCILANWSGFSNNRKNIRDGIFLKPKGSEIDSLRMRRVILKSFAEMFENCSLFLFSLGIHGYNES